MDQYNFEGPEGMDLMVFERSRASYGSDMLDDEGTGMAQLCQTILSDPQGKLDTVDIYPLANVLKKRTFWACRCWFSDCLEWRRNL